jgi:hypothetical protein
MLLYIIAGKLVSVAVKAVVIAGRALSVAEMFLHVLICR